jgi:transposase-like protein
MSRPSARDRWSVLVREHDASGMPTREFAKRRGVHPSTLSWWRCRFRREATAGRRESAFTALTVVEPVDNAPPVSHVVLTLTDWNATLRVDRSTDLALVRDVMAALC